MSPAPRSVPVLLAICLLAGGPGLPAAAGEPSPEACAALVRDDPEALESYRCYWSLARRGEWDEATRALEALLQIDPANHRARLYLGAIAGDRGEPRAASLYREAARGFRESGEPIGEVYARLSLSYVLRLRGRAGEAGSELQRAVEVAEAFGDPILLSRAQISLANQYMSEADWGRALGLLGRAREAVFPEGPSDIQANLLSAQGRAYWGLGLYERALRVYQRQAELDRRVGDPYREAEPRFNMALLAGRLQAEGTMAEREYLEILRGALAVARESGNEGVEVVSRLLLGQALEGEEGLAELEGALAVAWRIGDRARAHEARRLIAQRRWLLDPAARAEALDEVALLAEESRSLGEREELAMDLCVRALLVSPDESRQAWLLAHEQALDAVEEIRALQPEATARARVFSRWTFPYYRFAGLLLKGLESSPEPEADLELALRTVERMRARVLAEELALSGIAPASAEAEADGELEDLISRIAELQRTLTGTHLGSGDREDLLRRLESLETEEVELRDRMARSGAAGPERDATPASLERIRDRLGADRALLSFHLAALRAAPGPRVEEGGSWLVLLTREEARALPLPDRDEIEQRVAVFLGLAARRDGRESRAGESLFRELLGEALSGLSPEIRKLILVPDGSLHRLPFASLRDPRTGEFLGERYELSRAPSATLWARWRGRGGHGVRPAALALADPRVGREDGGEALRAAHPWVSGLELGPLPQARREARALVRGVGAGSRALEGAAASEAALKAAARQKLGVLHLAAHAVVDEQRPERSGVLLAPGAGEEDGLLQPREIVGLDLEGALVILSGCRSASGAQVSGEGVMGLARAFFRAGAHTVVGSLWPLRDDEAADLVSDLAGELGRGRSVSAALAAAQSSRIEAGAPVASWAGLVVLGDGDLVPRPEADGPSKLPLPWPARALGVLLLLGLLALLRTFFRRWSSRP